MGITHTTAATGSDSGDGKISKNAWNEAHTGGIESSLLTSAGDLITSGGGVDRARSGTASATDQWSPYVASNVNDGSESTEWMSNTEGTALAGHALKIDLGSAYTIASFRLYQYNHANTLTTDYKIQYSTDNSNWYDAYATSSSPADTGVQALTTSANARYWRMYIVSHTGVWSTRVYTFSLYDAVNPVRLGIGSEDYVLRVASGSPAWEAEFDATVPSTQAFGDAAATGSAATAARRDHKHAMPLVSYLDSYSRPLDGTMGDDFTEASLNARWTRVTFTSGMESYQQGGGSWMVVDMSSSTQAAHYYQSCPSGDWEFIASFALSRNHATQAMYGLCVVDSSGNGRGVVFYTDQNVYLGTIATNAYSTWTQVWTGGGWQYYLGGKVWGRIRKSGTTIYVSYSNNGTIWSQEYSVSDSSTWSRVFIGRVYGTQTTERFAIDLFDRVS